jgi:hypothetical protein
MKNKLEFLEDARSKKRILRSETGYAFVDEYRHCHIIVYGEFLKEMYEKVFNIK